MEIEELKYVQEAPRPLILTTRRFRRTAPLGMQVWRSVTRNFDYGTKVEHIEIACPGYELSNNGPVHKRKDDEDDE